MQVKRSIFRSYDIRGIYPDELSEEVAEEIGKATGTYLLRQNYHSKECVVGRDNRESSPQLSEAYIKGLLSTGCDVVDIGLTITPVIHFLTFVPGFGAGVNITASHNPKRFNGIKIDLYQAEPVSEHKLQNILRLVEQEDYEKGSGLLVKKDLHHFYIDHLKSKFKFSPNSKIVLNCGNGSTSHIAPEVLKQLGCNILPVECRLDSSFPNGVPDPENADFMKSLSEEVLSANADVGFAFDTDGDRLGVVDDMGVSHTNDRLLLLLVKDVLQRYPGSEIAFDVKSSQLAEEYIRQMGGIPRMVRTGRAHLLEALREGAVLGSELSGHTYFGKDYFGFDDGIYTACRVLEIMQRSGRKLSELMKEFPHRSNTPEIKVECGDSEKFGVIERIKKIVQDENEHLSLNIIDGVRVQVSPEGWFLVRASNTSPYLSIRAEAKDPSELSSLLSRIERLLEKAKVKEVLKVPLAA
jgi:phosphomannomutase / phosphoglucomutase